MQNDQLQAEVAKIRAAVQHNGGVTVGGEQLRILCPGELTAAQQFARISSIAQHEGWSFAFLPNGGVHFGTYRSKAAHISLS